MKRKKSTMQTLMLTATLLLGTGTVNCFPVYASETDDGSAAVAAIEEKMNNIKKNSGLTQENMNDTFSDTMKQFDDLSSVYTKMSDKYGKVNTANTGGFYLDYLENLRDSNDQTQYDDKLYAIQKSDISINDAELSSTYSKLKKNVKKNLSAAGVDIKSTTSSKNKKTAKKNTANRETLTSFSDASAKYEELVDNYKSLLTAEDDDGNTIKNPYANKNKTELTSTLGKSITQSYYDGDEYSGGKFVSTSDIFTKINDKAASMANEKSSQEATSNEQENKQYSSITDGIK